MALQGVSWAWQAQSIRIEHENRDCHPGSTKPVGWQLGTDDRESSKRGLSPIVRSMGECVVWLESLLLAT